MTFVYGSVKIEDEKEKVLECQFVSNLKSGQMKRIISIIYFVSILCNFQNYALASVDEDMATIDKYNHSASQFLSILNTIHRYYPESNNQKIGNRIVYAYAKVRKELPDISLYQVAVEIKGMVIEAEGKIKFKVVVATYIVTRPTDY